MTAVGKEFVPALGYRWLTALYDPVVALTTRERLFKHALLEQAHIEPGMTVLDLGCGTGTLAVWLKQRCPQARVAGLDGDPAMLAGARLKARARGVRVDFLEGSALDTHLPDDSFDRALSSLFFHHLSAEAKERAFAESRRVLRPGGELHVADWGRAGSFVMRLLFLQVQLLDGFANTRDNVAGELPNFMAKAGFQDVEECSRIPTLLGTLSLYRAINAPR